MRCSARALNGFIFVFQAEDGIRDRDVTGVQTCALPILPAAIDDSLAEAVGADTLAELRQEIRQRMQRDYDNVARQHLKRGLLDKLAEQYDFPVPPGMVEMEFNSIWAQYEGEKEARKEIAARQTAEAAATPTAEGPIDAAALVAPEETSLEGSSDRTPAGAEAAKPAEHEHEPVAHHARSHPGSAEEPIDAAAIVAPEETALEGASDSEPAAELDEEDEKAQEDF